MIDWSPFARRNQGDFEQRLRRRLWSIPKRIGEKVQTFPESFEYGVSHRDMAPQATVRCVEADGACTIGSGLAPSYTSKPLLASAFSMTAS